MDEASPQKDDSRELPIPAGWRSTFCDVVGAFVERDYRITSGVRGVTPITQATASHIESYISDYGEKLVALPEDTWQTSICLWMGSHWDVIVDLWTEAEGRSDMILSSRVSEVDGEYRFDIQMVYVP